MKIYNTQPLSPTSPKPAFIVLCIITVILAVILGYLIGRLTTVSFSIPDTPITITQDTRPQIPVVVLEGIRDGKLTGSISGDVRFFLKNTMIVPDDGGLFRAEPDILLENILSELIPKEAEFVASKKGKRYYPVFSPQGERLVPKNRVYFETEEEAKNAGYAKWSQ